MRRDQDTPVPEKGGLAFKIGGFIVVCSWCGRVRCSDGSWRVLCPADSIGEGMISHGICPDCEKRDHSA
ncbi:MAG: hypothetical protein JRF33_07870 [Deltaproteobacteria bacterium]|nr:hypothetical protein [Deltaproteobacteria bacterium]